MTSMHGIVLLFFLLGSSNAFTSISSSTSASGRIFLIHYTSNSFYQKQLKQHQQQQEICHLRQQLTLFYRSRIRRDIGDDYCRNHSPRQSASALSSQFMPHTLFWSRMRQNNEKGERSTTKDSALHATSSDELMSDFTTLFSSNSTSGAKVSSSLSLPSSLAAEVTSSSPPHTVAAERRRRRTNHISKPSNKKRKISSALHATSSEDLKSNSQKRKRKRKKKISSNAHKNKTNRRNSNSSSSRASKKRNKCNTLHHDENESDKDNKENDLDSEKTFPSLRGMERLSRAVAKASAEREISSTKDSNNSQPMSPFESSISAESFNQPKNNQVDETVSSLTQLTQVIDSQLYANGPRGTNRGEFPHLNGVVQHARDNMISLLGFNQVKGDWKQHSSKSTYNVAIIFGKDLVRDQITVEYASRIKTLVRLFKDEPDFRPSLVCFCGGIADGNHVSNADAGYIFFRHMCEAQDIDLEGVGIFIDNASRDDEDTVYCVTEKVKSDYGPSWLETTPTMNSLKQKVVNVHFTMISTEYHLCNINDVHHRSPQQSLLNAMEEMGDSFKGTYSNRQNNLMSKKMRSENTIANSMDYHNFNDDNQDIYNYGLHSSSSRRLTQNSMVRGVVNTNWSFQYATYPYIYAKDEATVFLGKCYLLGEELMPLLINMKGVVEQREFFQRDNYLMLTSIRRSLVDHIENLHKPSPSIKTALLRSQNLDGNKKYEGGKNIIGILEGALLSLGRCVDLVKPAGLHLGSVTKDEWKRALNSLEHSMSEIRDHCDPDRPLRPSEWGKLVDDEKGRLQI